MPSTKEDQSNSAPELFPSTDVERDVDLLQLREQYHSAAREELIAALQMRGIMSFDELELAAMQMMLLIGTCTTSPISSSGI